MFNPSGWAWFCRMVPELTNYPDNLPITAISLNRYVDDVRIVLMMHKHSHVSRLFGIFWLYLYRKFCCGYPCILEDEEYGPTFSFLQGTFGFSSGVLRCNYVARNLPSMLDTGRPKFYNMQHFRSYTQNHHQMRLASLIGKFCEIDAFSEPYSNVQEGVVSLVPELAYLGYPVSVVRSALLRMFQRSDNSVWLDMRDGVTCLLRAYH